MSFKLQAYGRTNRFENEQKPTVLVLDTKNISERNRVLRGLSAAPLSDALREKILEVKDGLLEALTPEIKEKLGIEKGFSGDKSRPIENVVMARIPLLSASEQESFLKSAEDIVQAQAGRTLK